jgi:hypothetical protein
MIRVAALLALIFLVGCAAPRPAAPRIPPPLPPVAAGVPLPPAPPRGEPEGFTGISGTALRTQFGAPAFVRRDNGAEIWRYDGPACRAFFFLYAETSGQAVRHVETLPRGQTIAADAGCLAAIRAKQGPASSPPP